MKETKDKENDSPTLLVEIAASEVVEKHGSAIMEKYENAFEFLKDK